MAAAFTDTGMFTLVVKRKFQTRYDKVLVSSHFLVIVSYDGVHSNFSVTLWCVFSLSPPYAQHNPPNVIFTTIRDYTDNVKKSCSSLLHYALQPFKAYVRSGLDVPTFATRRLHACHHAKAPSAGRWNCGREMSGNFAQMPTSTLHLGIFYM